MRPQAGASSPAPRPVIKPPVWTPEIPAYFYVGGLAGASAGIGLLTELRGEHALARRAWSIALAGALISPALLISDLGRPARFLHMLRMFKVTSPMSVGSWVLAGFGTSTAPAALHSFTPLGTPGRIAQVAAALLGLPLSAYTAALIANTAVPAWHEARLELPFLFTAGAAVSAGAALTAFSPVAEAQATRRLAIGGAVAELTVAQLMHRKLRTRGAGGAYDERPVKQLSRAAAALTFAGALVISRRSRPAAIAGGALLSTGALAQRWTVFKAGGVSAGRPQDTIDPQRARAKRS
jgi:hypothetical protein